MDHEIIILKNAILYKDDTKILVKTIHRTSGQYGILDILNNRCISPAIYNYIAPYHEGAAAIQLDGKWRFIDLNGETVFPWYDEYISPYINGTACMKQADKYYSLDKNGNASITNHLPKFKALIKGDRCNCNGDGCQLCLQLGYIPINYKFD